MKATIASSLSILAAMTLSAGATAAATPATPGGAAGLPSPGAAAASPASSGANASNASSPSSAPGPGSTSAPASASSPSAMAADVMGAAASPTDAWRKVVGLKFTVTVSLKGETQSEWNYLWDVKSGRCRIDARDRQGLRTFLLTDLDGDSSADLAFVETASQMRGESGTEGSGEKRWTKVPRLPGRHAPSPGRERFRKDTFWLLAPLRLQDPNVKLVPEGVERVAGVSYDVLRLTFETPGKIYRGALAYHLYVNPRTHMIDRWKVAYLDPGLAAEKARFGDDPDAMSGPIEEPQLGTWTWSDVRKTGPFELSLQRTQEGGDYVIFYRDVTLLTEIPPGVFEPPTKSQEGAKKAAAAEGASTAKAPAGSGGTKTSGAGASSTGAGTPASPPSAPVKSQGSGGSQSTKGSSEHAPSSSGSSPNP